jgi:putative transposase
MTELKHACHCVYGGYIGTVGAGVTTDIIKKYIETQGTKEEKEGCKQMKLLDFK